jgi:RNA polymerase sigma-70 factor (ECF subfamily)
MDDSRTNLFFRLFMTSQTKIYAYILMCVPNEMDADDIAQETATVMWRKFSDFTPGTDFVSWGKAIAYNKILDFRKTKGRSPVVFNDALLHALDRQAENAIDEVDTRLEALRQCLRKLKAEDRNLIRYHYEDAMTIKGIAERSQRSVQGLYKVMSRIHNRLMDCVDFRLRTQENTA